jgi:hypothetical protein
MASSQTDTNVIGATAITLGALGASVFPTIIRSPSISGGQIIVGTLGSGATIQVLPTGMSGLSIAGATAVGASISGWPISTSLGFSWEGPAAFYLACTGATSVVTCLFRYSAGATLA